MMFIGALLSLCAAASAIPMSSASSDMSSSSLVMSGDKLKSLVGALSSKGGVISQDIDQNISCTVSYTLTLGGTAPPYTIDLATFDLSNCTYTGA